MPRTLGRVSKHTLASEHPCDRDMEGNATCMVDKLGDDALLLILQRHALNESHDRSTSLSLRRETSSYFPDWPWIRAICRTLTLSRVCTVFRTLAQQSFPPDQVKEAKHYQMITVLTPVLREPIKFSWCPKGLIKLESTKIESVLERHGFMYPNHAGLLAAGTLRALLDAMELRKPIWDSRELTRRLLPRLPVVKRVADAAKGIIATAMTTQADEDAPMTECRLQTALLDALFSFCRKNTSPKFWPPGLFHASLLALVQSGLVADEAVYAAWYQSTAAAWMSASPMRLCLAGEVPVRLPHAVVASSSTCSKYVLLYEGSE